MLLPCDCAVGGLPSLTPLIDEGIAERINNVSNDKEALTEGM